MRKIFKEAHKMTRKLVEKYDVDYQAQFGLCLAYLLENKEVTRMDMVEKLIKEAREYRDEEKMAKLKEINGENWDEKLERKNIEIISLNYFEKRQKEICSELSKQIMKTEDKEERRRLRETAKELRWAKFS